MTISRKIKINVSKDSLRIVQGMFIGRRGTNIKNLSSKFPDFNIQLDEDVINIIPRGRQQRHNIINGTLSFHYVKEEIDRIISNIMIEVQRRKDVAYLQKQRYKPKPKKIIVKGWTTICH